MTAPRLMRNLGARLRFRGPDGTTSWSGESCAFVHALLRAGPRAAGVSFLSGRFVIVGDTATAPEAILRLYERHGTGCVEHLDGEFAFLIWDISERKLFCARDHFGVKPLFYSVHGETILAGNTLDCLRSHPAVPEGFNDQALADFLLFGAIQDPAATAFQHIHRLPAAHTLTWCNGALSTRRYWTLPVGQPLRYEKPEQYVEHFREELVRAAGDRVPPESAAVLMSGGVDSTLVAAAARKTGAKLKAFTVVCDQPVADPERHFSRLAGEYLGIPIEYLDAAPFELFSGREGFSVPTPEPVDNPLFAIFTTHLRLASGFSNVALSGQGGDPLFLNSAHLAAAMLRQGRFSEVLGGIWRYHSLRGGFPPLGLRGELKQMLGMPAPTYGDPYPDWLSPEIEAELHLRERWAQAKAVKPLGSHPDRPQAYSALTDPVWTSRFEMYDAGWSRAPLWVRHPLFDRRLVEFCLSIPPIPWFVQKTLARAAMKGWLPEPVRVRPKTPVLFDPILERLARTDWLRTAEIDSILDRYIVRGRWLGRFSTNAPVNTSLLRPLSLQGWINYLTQVAGKYTTEEYDPREGNHQKTL